MPTPTRPDPEVPDVRARLEGLDDLSPDLQIRTLAGVEADLRAALDPTKG